MSPSYRKKVNGKKIRPLAMGLLNPFSEIKHLSRLHCGNLYLFSFPTLPSCQAKKGLAFKLGNVPEKQLLEIVQC